ncbi:MAG: DUF748 domain-containing protein [Magnetococcales bacterium]|nr:DUF748 domain-containing protein [Magnetococcales bacterium]
MTRIVLALLLAVVVMVASVTLGTLALWDADHYRESIRKTIESISGHRVKLEKVSYNPLNGLFTLELSHLEVEATDPDNPPQLLVPTVFVGVDPLSLALRQPQPVSIMLVNPQINIVARLHPKLIDQAQNRALVSDRNMARELGRGWTGLALGKVGLQNGILTFIDSSRSAEGTLIIDHIQLNVHALSSRAASPVTASARVHNIPFTVNGQVGPLPASLDPFAMPVLLTLDAKSIGLADLNDLFPDTTIQARLSRGILTTTLHGTLKAGLQTSSWLQLDGLEWVNTESMPQNKKVPFWPLSVGRRKMEGAVAMDIAIRQKSLLRLHRDYRSSLTLKEFFIYVNGSPIIETHGRIRGGRYGSWDMDFSILNSIGFARLPIPKNFPLSGETPVGSISIQGSWPEGGGSQMPTRLVQVRDSVSALGEKGVHPSHIGGYSGIYQ